MRTLLAFGALALLASPGQAQTAPAIAAPAPVDPARLVAAQKAVAALVPPGIYMTLMREQLPRMMDAMMEQLMGQTPGQLGLPADGKTPGGRTIGQSAAAADPHFQERMQITNKVMFEEFGTVFNALEPRVRAGLARAFARKFTLAQLDDLNAFFATSTGAVFAHDYLLTFMDPELMQEMMGAMPEVLKAMPAIMSKAEKATAHLPPPKKAAP